VIVAKARGWQTQRRVQIAPNAPATRPQYYRPTHRIIPSAIQIRFRSCWRTPSIAFAEGNSIRASPIRWVTWQVFY
jgi:hypothetical protein